MLFRGGAVINLNDLLPANSGWVLQEATGINNAGQVTGVGTIGGQTHAFRMTVDLSSPQVASLSAAPVTAAGQATESVTVTYTDAFGFNTATIGPADLLVTPAADTATHLGVSSATPSFSPDGKTATVVYTVTAPSGAWGNADNGAYTITVLPGQVANQNGAIVPEAFGSFNVNVAAVAPQAPSAVIMAPTDVKAAGVQGVTVTVTYTDDHSIDLATISPGNISVTGPTGAALTVTGFAVAPSTGNAAVESATYTVVAPSGAFQTADNGAYTITVNANSVFDADDHLPVPSVTAAFNVAVPAPKPTVDPTFNSGNPVSTAFVAESLVALPDGRFLVTGHQGVAGSTNTQGVVQRFNADGSVDTTFGSGGEIVTGAANVDALYGVGIDPSGRIVATGSRNGDFAVWRWSANGNPDNHFGSGGVAVADFGGADTAYGVAIGADGSVTLGGASIAAGGTSTGFAFARFLSNGALDKTFGAGGRVTVPADSSQAVVGALALSPSGGIVAAGASGPSVEVFRLTAQGALDSTFNGGQAVQIGQLGVRTDLGSLDRTEGLAVQSDGKVVVANRTSSGHFGVVRLNADGTTDTTFGSGGLATIDFGGDDDADGVQVQGTGQVIVFGTTSSGGSAQTAVAALTPSGQLDPSFAAGGKYTTSTAVTPTAVHPRAIHIGDLFLRAFGQVQSNGQLLVGASNPAALSPATPLRRLNVPGSGTVGTFGAVGKHSKKLTFLDADGTRITVTMTGGGVGTVYYNGSQFDILLSGTTRRSAAKISGVGGDGRVAIRSVTVDGTLGSFSATRADVTGTFYVVGAVGNIAIGSLSGDLVARDGISSLTVGRDVSGSRILAGASLGTDNAIGGTGSAADTFGGGAIGKIKVGGAVVNSTIGAGVNPVDGIFRNGNDVVVGGTASRIGSVSIHSGVDTASRFFAGAFGKLKTPRTVKPMANSTFEIL